MVLPPTLVWTVPQPPANSLAAVWPQLAWSVPDRGALLVVEPESALLLPERTLPPGKSHNPLELLPLFERTLTRFSTIAAVARPTMRLYDPPRNPTGLTRALRDINPEPYALLLLASLTGGLRGQAISEQGVPLTALDARQRRWLEGIAPETVAFSLPSAQARELTETDRAALRLRVRRTLELTAHTESEGYPLTGQTPQETTVRTLPLLEPAVPLDPERDLLGRVLVAGKLKPTELEPTDPALRASVPLTGATTVGELVERLARATKLAVRASAGLAEKRVLVKGEQAQAGDLLAALCRGVDGTVRRLRSSERTLYLLVEDLPTAAERRERATQTYLQLQGPIEQERRQLTTLAAGARRRLIRGRALESLPRSTQEVPEVLWKQAEAFDEAGVALEQLTPLLRTELDAGHRERLRVVELLGGAVPERPRRVSAVQKLVLELVLPDLVAVAPLTQLDASTLRTDQPIPEPIAPLSLPATCPTRAWMVRLPDDETQREALLTLAQSRKLTELRVPVPPGEAAEKALARLAEAAQKQGLGVVPVLSPLAPLEPRAPRDRDALGRSQAQWALQSPFAALAETLFPIDAVAPEAVDTAAFARRIDRLAALPGVTGIGLEGLAAPGYPDTDPEDWPLWRAGFDPRRRLDFALTHGLDPADLVAPTPFSNLLPNNKPDPRAELWEQELRLRRDSLVARLAKAVEKTPVPLSLVVSRLGQSGHWERWLGQFVRDEVRFDEEGERLPLVSKAAQPGLLHIRALAYRARLTALDAELESLLDDDSRFRDWLDTELQEVLRPNPEAIDTWHGFVLDVTDRPLSEALSLLKNTFSAKD